jgi:O-acetyl-ADP-ribose deacetylase (regulator of RNase III)
MDQNAAQAERLEYLTRVFIEDSDGYQNLALPDGEEDQRRLLRSLMNIRMPKPLSPEVLAVQDAYLKARNQEKGIIKIQDIPTIREQGSDHPNGDVISIWQGDITRLASDAIVNAANSQMLGCFVPMHTCIDNCIHTFAGVELRLACHRQMQTLREKYGKTYEQPTAVPMLTDGYNLPAAHVIHVVGPIVGNRLTPALEKDLSDCYQNVLDLCVENGLSTVAFCCLSTGVFRFPNDRACELAVKTVTDWLNAHPGKMKRVIFNVFKDEDKELYEAELCCQN